VGHLSAVTIAGTKVPVRQSAVSTDVAGIAIEDGSFHPGHVDLSIAAIDSRNPRVAMRSDNLARREHPKDRAVESHENCPFRAYFL